MEDLAVLLPELFQGLIDRTSELLQIRLTSLTAEMNMKAFLAARTH